MKVTIYDVAKEANVSIATVSKVINNTGRISEKTKKKVLNVMKKLDYQPNIMASALMGKQTKTIGLLIPDLANPFFAELARSIEDRGHEFGYNLVICSTDYKEEKENKYISLLKRKSVDGFILASGFENLGKVEQLVKEDFPVAIVARDFPMFPVNTVALDDFMGGYLAASYLIDLGHENIGIIARDVWSNRERIRGFKQALDENQLTFPTDFEYIEKMSHIIQGKNMTIKYLKSLNPPTAIFACNDLLAIGAIQAIKEMGMNVPEHVSVIGFDNTIIATIVEPPLTTIAQPIQNMGKEVMDLMISQINGEKKEKIRVTLHPSLIVRESTGKFNIVN
ncbi:LacI family DNA-binding transcriptional regulator [Schinkia azotoformans]|uniref:LacI family transcriptional regulator n=1 Tax=Schinkia azotoformans LMG 9581 TaxID=1131731 RepID=K6BWD2_SCHAZ|nr:LacI family DNA-binding transcriptional regulator [Schinkia azotoformans]EKN63245.1 LacI family transcriptional regulator [Schinkia azotoformans LMG 9581]MEC1637205.1 LacI family DNA-binding transcriptional regulator [Schinkia azotoformans]MEC1720653.1 LacI family DNA-binding transcriptional regulator [Schinkia azotoformans]MEC1943609.1 LacI family DNA-binding transcriptional regulator [Schinkia azotoformans]MED4411792.1 LacI family DNA-binding transcriptional regulator [Schinkia azotoforma